MINGPAPSRRAALVSLSDARARVLEFLQGQTTPLSPSQVAEAMSLHENTARLHLDGLVKAGLAVRRPSEPHGRGRPAMLYSSGAPQDADPRLRDYAYLAAALASVVARNSDDPQAEARSAGAGWGAALLAGRTADTAAAARREVVRVLADLGFSPDTDASARSVALRTCPLLDVAREHPGVVCQVHLGVIQGGLREMGHETGTAELFPFAEPGACRLLME